RAAVPRRRPVPRSAGSAGAPAPCAAPHADPAGDAVRLHPRQPAWRCGDHRNPVRPPGRRPPDARSDHQQGYPGGARHHPAGGLHLRGRQPAGRPSQCPDRATGTAAMSMSTQHALAQLRALFDENARPLSSDSPKDTPMHLTQIQLSDLPPQETATQATDEELLARFTPIFARIAEGAIEREQNRELPYEQVAWLREAGFGTLRVPRRYGGFGASLPQLFRLITLLGEADSNLPQIFRAHFGFVEGRLNDPDDVSRDIWFP